MPGSKQRRQRASYVPAAPTTIRSSDPTRRWVCLAGLAASHADGQRLGDRFRDRQQVGYGCERTAHVVRVEAGDDDAFARVRQLVRDVDEPRSEEVRFIDADYFRAPFQFGQDLGRIRDHFGLHPEIAVRDDLVGGVAIVDRRLENLHALAGDHGAAEAANQLLALA